MFMERVFEGLLIFNGSIADALIYTIGMIVLFVAILVLVFKILVFIFKCSRSNKLIYDLKKSHEEIETSFEAFKYTTLNALKIDIYNRLDNIEKDINNTKIDVDDAQIGIANICQAVKLLSQKMNDFENNINTGCVNGENE